MPLSSLLPRLDFISTPGRVRAGPFFVGKTQPAGPCPEPSTSMKPTARRSTTMLPGPTHGRVALQAAVKARAIIIRAKFSTTDHHPPPCSEEAGRVRPPSRPGGWPRPRKFALADGKRQIKLEADQVDQTASGWPDAYQRGAAAGLETRCPGPEAFWRHESLPPLPAVTSACTEIWSAFEHPRFGPSAPPRLKRLSAIEALERARPAVELKKIYPRKAWCRADGPQPCRLTEPQGGLGIVARLPYPAPGGRPLSDGQLNPASRAQRFSSTLMADHA